MHTAGLFVHMSVHLYLAAYPGSPPLDPEASTANLGLGLSSLDPVTTTHVPVSEVLPLQVPANTGLSEQQQQVASTRVSLPMHVLSTSVPKGSPLPASNMKGEPQPVDRWRRLLAVPAAGGRCWPGLGLAGAWG